MDENLVIDMLIKQIVQLINDSNLSIGVVTLILEKIFKECQNNNNKAIQEAYKQLSLDELNDDNDKSQEETK